MKIPTQKVINGLNRTKNFDANNETRILWNVLSNAKGYVEMDINEMISMFYDTQSMIIISMVEEYGSSTEILKFLANVKDLITDKEYLMLEDVRLEKMDKEIRQPIKKSKDKSHNI